MNHIALYITILVLISCLVVAQQSANNDPNPDIFYVPTPYNVVEAMLEVAKVGPGDIVYDLGSGDGRIVISAAQDYGATGVGVEIDPKYIEMAKLNALEAKVMDKVRFVQDDLFEIDFTDATVVTLYLSDDINLRLRPTLLNDLQPGTRIVSHEFSLGDWEPQKTLDIGGHRVYYWVVP